METLSSNHFSHDQQVADVVSYLEHHNPVRHAEFLEAFPEWHKLGFPRDVISSQLTWVTNPAIGMRVSAVEYLSDGKTQYVEGEVVNYQHDWPEVKWQDGTVEVLRHDEVQPVAELTSWMADWIEQHCDDIHWEEGEPWLGFPDEDEEDEDDDGT